MAGDDLDARLSAGFATFAPVTDRAALGRALVAAHAGGRAAWPGITVEPGPFGAYLGERAAGRSEADVLAALATLPAADLYLAHAVLARRPGAVERFVADVLPTIDAPLAHLGADAARRDELRQLVLEAVVVGGERGPALARYAGRSDLRGWLRSVAVRIALKAWARERPAESIDDWEELAEQLVDPGLAVLRDRYQDEVAAAFREAVATLSPRQRTLLRLHHLDGLTVDELARIYAVHRATAARWVAAARDALFEETRVRLHGRLGLDESTFVSVVRLVQSQLVASLRRLLA